VKNSSAGTRSKKVWQKFQDFIVPCKVLVWAGIAQSVLRLGYGPNDLEFEFRQGQIFFSSPKRGSGGVWSASRPLCFTPWRSKARFPLVMSLMAP